MGREGTTEEYVVVWFPPNVEKREKKFFDFDKALKFSEKGESGDYRVAQWNPLIEWRTVTITEEVRLYNDGKWL